MTYNDSQEVVRYLQRTVGAEEEERGFAVGQVRVDRTVDSEKEGVEAFLFFVDRAWKDVHEARSELPIRVRDEERKIAVGRHDGSGRPDEKQESPPERVGKV